MSSVTARIKELEEEIRRLKSQREGLVGILTHTVATIEGEMPPGDQMLLVLSAKAAIQIVESEETP